MPRAVVPLSTNQTEVRIRLDNEVLDWFRERINDADGSSYQNLINAVLRAYIQDQEDAALLQAITEGERAGRVSREEVFAVLQGRK
jgi:metal-responsive CopG/Arc/MetJ family transcriptional regulator